jgi:hypothetical protein
MGVQSYLESSNIDPSDVGPFILIHTILSAILVGSTWGICYFAAGGNSPPSYLKSSEHIPSSILLNSIVKIPLISDCLKKRAVSVMVRFILN